MTLPLLDPSFLVVLPVTLGGSSTCLPMNLLSSLEDQVSNLWLTPFPADVAELALSDAVTHLFEQYELLPLIFFFCMCLRIYSFCYSKLCIYSMLALRT